MSKKLIFLGGTCGKNNWREAFTALLVLRGVPEESIHNPVVKDWNEAAQAAEQKAKAEATHFLFYLADPMIPESKLPSYSMVEATMGLYDRPDKTVVVFDYSNLSGHAESALRRTEKDLRARFPEGNIYTVGSAVEFLVNA